MDQRDTERDTNETLVSVSLFSSSLSNVTYIFSHLHMMNAIRKGLDSIGSYCALLFQCIFLQDRKIPIFLSS